MLKTLVPVLILSIFVLGVIYYSRESRKEKLDQSETGYETLTKAGKSGLFKRIKENLLKAFLLLFKVTGYFYVVIYLSVFLFWIGQFEEGNQEEMAFVFILVSVFTIFWYFTRTASARAKINSILIITLIAPGPLALLRIASA